MDCEGMVMINHDDALKAVESSLDRPSAARIYDYFIGGPTNYATDRHFPHIGPQRLGGGGPEGAAAQRRVRPAEPPVPRPREPRMRALRHPAVRRHRFRPA